MKYPKYIVSVKSKNVQDCRMIFYRKVGYKEYEEMVQIYKDGRKRTDHHPRVDYDTAMYAGMLGEWVNKTYNNKEEILIEHPELI